MLSPLLADGMAWCLALVFVLVTNALADLDFRYMAREIVRNETENGAPVLPKDLGSAERTWKTSKKGLAYLITGLAIKALLLLKLAVAKLAVIGKVSILLSKLSLLISLLLAFGKYFGGISKMLKTTPAAHAQQSYHPSGHGEHSHYLTRGEK